MAPDSYYETAFKEKEEKMKIVTVIVLLLLSTALVTVLLFDPVAWATLGRIAVIVGLMSVAFYITPESEYGTR